MLCSDRVLVTIEAEIVKEEAGDMEEPDSEGVHPAAEDLEDELAPGAERLQTRDANFRVGSLALQGERCLSVERDSDSRRPASPGAASNSYMCDSCGVAFQRKPQLIQHIKTHLPEKPKTLHFKSNSLKRKRDNTKKSTYSCPICGKEFAQIGHLNRHKQSHAPDIHFSCEICDKSFSRFDTLKIHVQIHARDKLYGCDVCDKVFTQSGNLKRHERLHRGLRPYACDICKRRFTQSNDLKKHKRVHVKMK